MKGLTDFWFKKDGADRTVFFPWGGFGKGRVLPNRASETQIRRRVGFHWTGIFSISVLGGVASTYAVYAMTLYVVICGLWLTWYYYEVRNLVKDLPLSDAKLTFAESYANYFSEWSNFTLWLAAALLVSLFLGSLLMVIGADRIFDRLIALFCAAFSLWLVSTLGYVLSSRYRSDRRVRGKPKDDT